MFHYFPDIFKFLFQFQKRQGLLKGNTGKEKDYGFDWKMSNAAFSFYQ